MIPGVHGSPQDWLNLLLRWFHVVAGIAWIGQTYLFNWFEKTLEPDKDDKPNIAGRLWMVHGGGFYLVEKQKTVELMPRTLHWFKWETMLTWLSGFFLLLSTYYAGHLMLDFESGLSERAAIALGLGSLAGGYGAYRLIWRACGDNELLGAAVCVAALLAAAWAMSLLLTSRAVFLHVGAMMGTIMTANVWMTILPNQRKMLAAVLAGGQADMRLGAQGKRCSKHNTYMSIPVIFLMLSGHFPFVFGHPQAWALLAPVMLGGFWAAKILRGD